MAGRDDAGLTGGVEMILVSYAIVLASYLLILLPSNVILALTVEDGLIENMVCSCSTVSCCQISSGP